MDRMLPTNFDREAAERVLLGLESGCVDWPQLSIFQTSLYIAATENGARADVRFAASNRGRTPSHDKESVTRHRHHERTGARRRSKCAQSVGSTDARDPDDASRYAAGASMQHDLRSDSTSAERPAGHPARAHPRRPNH